MRFLIFLSDLIDDVVKRQVQKIFFPRDLCPD